MNNIVDAYLTSLVVNEKIINYTNKFWNILTDNEYKYLINHNYEIYNFYTNPKLRKSKELKKLKIN